MADTESRHPATQHLLDQFAYEHLPSHLQEVSKPLGDLARQLADRLGDGPEKTTGLRKLLEAKDCLVRQAVIDTRQVAVMTPVGDVVMDFGDALRKLKDGERVTRLGWNGKGQFLELQVPDEHSKMTLPYIFITTVQAARVPWLASQTDMLAADWVIV